MKNITTIAFLIVAFASHAESVATPAPVRLAYNYCTLSYTFAYYGEKEWTDEVERLSMAGYNAALLMDGTFKVWELTLRELGMSEEDIFAFIPDECARAWWLMGNLAGEGGPLDQATIDADGARGRFIAEKMRDEYVSVEHLLLSLVKSADKTVSAGVRPVGCEFPFIQIHGHRPWIINIFNVSKNETIIPSLNFFFFFESIFIHCIKI